MTADAGGARDVDAYIARTGALDLKGVAWQDMRDQPLAPELVFALRQVLEAAGHGVIEDPCGHGRVADAVDRFRAPVGAGVRPAGELQTVIGWPAAPSGAAAPA